MPDSPTSWAITLLMLALPGAALVGLWYMAKGLLGRDNVQLPAGTPDPGADAPDSDRGGGS